MLPSPTPRRSRKLLIQGVLLLAAVAMLILSVLPRPSSSVTGHPVVGSTAPVLRSPFSTPTTPLKLHLDFEVEPKTHNEMMALPAEQIGGMDIARINLLCAAGLPTTKGLDVEHALGTLDTWAAKVAVETQRHLYRVTDPRYADRYGHSEAHYRAEMLAQVLQEDLGVHYNPETVGDFSFADASTGFIHGMIPKPGQKVADTPGGTCASMPVLYVAVGRRLGYPMKLSTTDSHVFARWDGRNHANVAWRDYFNCETTNGFHRFDDDYYRAWPRPVTDHQVVQNGYLVSLAPTQELAFFMATRGHHAVDRGQKAFAARCYENAHGYDPQRPAYRSWFLQAAVNADYRATYPELQRQLDVKRREQAGPMEQFARAAAGSRQHRATPRDFGRVANNPRPVGSFGGNLPAVGYSVEQPPDPTTYYDPTKFGSR